MSASISLPGHAMPNLKLLGRFSFPPLAMVSDAQMTVSYTHIGMNPHSRLCPPGRFPEIELLGSPLLMSSFESLCEFNILTVRWLAEVLKPENSRGAECLAQGTALIHWRCSTWGRCESAWGGALGSARLCESPAAFLKHRDISSLAPRVSKPWGNPGEVRVSSLPLNIGLGM